MEVRNRITSEQDFYPVAIDPKKVPAPSSSIKSCVNKVRVCAVSLYSRVEALAQYKVARPFVWAAKSCVWLVKINVKQTFGGLLVGPCHMMATFAVSLMGGGGLKKEDFSLVDNSVPPLAVRMIEAGAPYIRSFLSGMGTDVTSPEAVNNTLEGFFAPVIEELIFRYTIQGLVLTELPKAILKRVSPKNVDRVDSTIARIFRVTLTTALFSACHLNWWGTKTDAYLQDQIVATLVLGLWLGALKESRLGTWGAFGLHTAFNNVAQLARNNL